MRGIRRRQRPDTTEQAPDTGQEQAVDETGQGPWTVVELPASYRRGRQAARVVGAACLLVLAGLGAWRALWPLEATPVAPSSSAPAVDTTAVAGVAERAAASWLTLDTVEDRQTRLGLVWDEPGKAGWDGQGAVTVTDTMVMTVTPTGPDTADVTVAVSITAGADPATQTRSWVGVAVPVQVTDGTASVAGQPRLVGLPHPAPVPEADSIDQPDTEMSETTRDSLDQFVQAWAAGNTQSVAAPGSTIPALPEGVEATVVDWKVRSGSGITRTGQARITLTVGGASLTATYDVTITKVTSGTSSRWQVSHIG